MLPRMYYDKDVYDVYEDIISKGIRSTARMLQLCKQAKLSESKMFKVLKLVDIHKRSD